MGPAVDDDRQIEALVEGGMDAARINLGYGEPAEHVRWVRRLRTLSESLGRPVAIIADIPGPKVRVGHVTDGTIELLRGSKVELFSRDGATVGTAARIPVDAGIFSDELIRGDHIRLSDGLVELIVMEIKGPRIIAEVTHGGTVLDRTDVHLPGLPLRHRAVTDDDWIHVDRMVGEGVDFVAITYVRDASDVLEVREHFERLGVSTGIMAKIERPEAFTRLDGILTRADAVMIRRGDLGAQIEITRMPLVQKEVVRLANQRGVPVVIGTQMLSSMLTEARPTRAEASDVANAIVDGADGVSLSAETAIGRNPIAALEFMSRMVAETESEHFARPRGHHAETSPRFADASARMAADVAVECGARLIACCTHTGETAGLVSKYRPEVPIVALAADAAARRRLAITWGVEAAELTFGDTIDDTVQRVEARLLASGRAKRGDRLVILLGSSSVRGEVTDTVRLHEIGRSSDSLAPSRSG